MAALTASSVIRENVGSLTLHIVSFSAVTGDDTWASGLDTGVVGYWANDTNAGGSTLVVGVNVKNTAGSFKFQTSVAAHPVTLYVISKS